MGGLCARMPKPMLPLGNVPMLQYILDGLAMAGIARAHLVVGHRAELVRRHFAQRPHSLPLDFIEQHNPSGTGSATLLAKDTLAGDHFLLAFGDIIIPRAAYGSLIKAHARGGWDHMLTTRWVPDPFRGAAVYVESDRVQRIIEKPPPGTSTTHYDSVGVHILPRRVFELLATLKPSPRGEYELTDAIAMMVAQGLKVGAHEVEGFWFNMTDPEALIAANSAIIMELGEQHESDVSRARLHAATAIGRDCRIGRCEIGPQASVGDRCILDDGCRVSHSILMPGCHVAPHANIEYAVLAPGVEVGPDTHVKGQINRAEVIAP
jgi:NDP-sugar pyrophosphorylase family protein